MTYTKPDVVSVAAAPFQVLDWDSDFFGVRIARVDPAALIASDPATLDAQCAHAGVECLYLLADVDDQPSCDAAAANGFRLVDIRMTLDTTAPGAHLGGDDRAPLVRAATTDDVARLKAITRDCFRHTRFYADGGFDRRRCDAMYELWIEKSCLGWADRVFTVDAGDRSAGYVSCHLRDGVGQIGLFAVGAESRGHGTGASLIGAAMRWFADRGAESVFVVTQARNAAALKIYQRAGMTVRSMQLWFHKWCARRSDGIR
jgi:dTDP-4-amino-4,6-dideoxy-D-galactose acyltransferase